MFVFVAHQTIPNYYLIKFFDEIVGYVYFSNNGNSFDGPPEAMEEIYRFIEQHGI